MLLSYPLVDQIIYASMLLYKGPSNSILDQGLEISSFLKLGVKLGFWDSGPNQNNYCDFHTTNHGPWTLDFGIYPFENSILRFHPLEIGILEYHSVWIS